MLGNYSRYDMGSNVLDLEDVKLRKPAGSGTRWKGVSHYQLITALLAELREGEFSYSGTRYNLSRSGSDLVFSCLVELPDVGVLSVKEGHKSKPIALHPSFGVAASNARRKGLTFYSGFASATTHHKIVTTAWLGDKYTIKFNLAAQVTSAVNHFLSTAQESAAIGASLKTIQMNEGRIRKVLMEAGARNLMPWSRIGRIADALNGDRVSAWSLSVEFAKLVELNPPGYQMDQMLGLTQILKELYPDVLGAAQWIGQS